MAVTKHTRSIYILIKEILELTLSQAFKTNFSSLVHWLLEADKILKSSIADVLSGKCLLAKKYEHYETSYNLLQWPSLKKTSEIKIT